jgi:hypothetical protein
MSYQPRDSVIEFLRKTLYGPAGGATEEINGTPLLRYMSGLLFPSGIKVGEVADAVTATAEEDAAVVDQDADSQVIDTGVELTSEALPSAVGISFCVKDSERVRCTVQAAVYLGQSGGSRVRSEKNWVRSQLNCAETGNVVEIDKRRAGTPVSLWSGKARLVSKWRTGKDGTAIVTVALVNAQSAGGRGPDPEKTLFQVGLSCAPTRGKILRYPEVGSRHADDSEEAEVDFLYRAEAVFARGHGAAARWDKADAQGCQTVAVEFIPSVDVPRASFALAVKEVDTRYRDLTFLVTATKTEVCDALRGMVDAYGKWVASRLKEARDGARPLIAGRVVDRAAVWHRRMHRGLAILQANDIAWRCFRMANEAMAIQMVLARSRPKVPYDHEQGKACPDLSFAGKSWRPFQIAFFLASIESLVDPSSEERDIVDVIWFPTGGGKTEAYLLISAFELIRRRLTLGDSDQATAIISRYTLRFLTVQQFQRTAALVIALELLRRRQGTELGSRPFTLGLWVGGGVTPNRFAEAHEWLQAELASSRPKNKFLLQTCPCCGTNVFPSERKPRSAFGVVATLADFKFNCPSRACEFHAGLPLQVVDEGIYRAPPSIILGTVDKFAQLPWDDRARVIFGGLDDKSPPPSLILQDELHLISGPLGTLASPYDIAIDTIIKVRGGHSKRICSTATIRNAAEQVRGLYGRGTAVFPPPCAAWDDAFFFSTDRSVPGRTYVGVMGQGYIKPVVAMAWTAAAILQSIKEVALPSAVLDSYWTLLAYHNSRRELGRTISATRDEVQARIQAIASSPALARRLGEPLELSAQNVKQTLGEAIEALERSHDQQNPAVDFVPCTSIISVGVDIERLGVMLVNGQPKSTSEYIQATSRVGRADIPGLVVSLLAATKPRDRSHYEDFRGYHEALYRHVEPTSVTPCALPARERTLHAALVSIVRHGTPYRSNGSASDVDFGNSSVKQAVDEFDRLMRQSDPSEAENITELIDLRVKEWREMASSGHGLLYERRQAGIAFRALLAEYGKGENGVLWKTMNSVRNVDTEIDVKTV